MSGLTVKVSGLAELEKQLREMAPAAAKTAVRRALKTAAELLQDRIEITAPYKEGFLAHNIVETSSESGGLTRVEVGSTKQAFWASFQEFGTRFQRKQPFMQPAFDECAPQVLDDFQTNLKEEMDKLGIK